MMKNSNGEIVETKELLLGLFWFTAILVVLIGGLWVYSRTLPDETAPRSYQGDVEQYEDVQL